MMKGRLWEPFRIGQMELRNRLVMPPMVTRYATDKGYVTERTKNYYEARARGGAALLIVEATFVHPCGHAFANQLNISSDSYIPGMSELVQAIHRHGAKVGIQLHHGGRMAKSELSGMQPVAPSPLASSGGEVPRELSLEEIGEVITSFAEAALRAKKAGFNGVEIHGAHGYLIDQFISRSSNKRQDEYGGDLPNRARFLIEVIKRVREAVGNGYPVWCRINGKEYGLEEETTLEEAQQIAQMAQEAGVDAIHVSAFGPLAPNNLTSSTFVPCVILDLVEGIKKVVTVPVIASGRITPEAAESILEEGKADLIAIGKALLADPEFPSKVASGRLEDITPCIVCMGCRDDLRLPTVVGIRCRVNAALGREAEYKIVPAEKSRKVLVIGGGPAGMEAARVAALRGHKVTLWEKESKLGGQLIQAAIPPHKDPIGFLTDYQQKQLKKLGVDVSLNKTATAAMVEEFRPEVVVLSTGVKPFLPEIPGIELVHAVQAGDVLENKAVVGDRVVIIGGEMVGCETAEFLAEKGKKVTVTRRGSEMALGVGPSLRAFFLNRLLKKGVTLLTEIRYIEVTPEGLTVTTQEGERKTIEADTIVLAAGAISNNELNEEIKGKVPAIYLAGDCVEPRTIRDAIADGYRIGLGL
jgi:2,4-dienoyl-CoA reductase-like NADH-dependent reductase (Old Yellow Enzyme family)/thioredoxin reductase